FPSASIMTTFREMGVAAVESDRDAQRWAELQELLNSARGGRGGNFNVDQRYNEPGGKGDNNTQNPSPPGNSAYQQQLDFAYRVVVREKARREGQWAYIFDDSRATVAPGLAAAFPMRAGLTFQTVEVQLGSMRPIWLPSAEHPEYLLIVRGARVGGKPVFQGIVVDWGKLQALLRDDVSDLFPDAHFAALPPGEPARPDRAMTALPVEFNPILENLPAQPNQVDPESLAPAGWTPLRIGLAFAWGAALIALLAVGLGGWSLLDLSERRIRFVS